MQFSLEKLQQAKQAEYELEKAKIENNSNPELPTIPIHNPVRFFELLYLSYSNSIS